MGTVSVPSFQHSTPDRLQPVTRFRNQS